MTTLSYYGKASMELVDAQEAVHSPQRARTALCI